jgi:hypothetical protein
MIAPLAKFIDWSVLQVTYAIGMRYVPSEDTEVILFSVALRRSSRSWNQKMRGVPAFVEFIGKEAKQNTAQTSNPSVVFAKSIAEFFGWGSATVSVAAVGVSPTDLGNRFS